MPCEVPSMSWLLNIQSQRPAGGFNRTAQKDQATVFSVDVYSYFAFFGFCFFDRELQMLQLPPSANMNTQCLKGSSLFFLKTERAPQNPKNSSQWLRWNGQRGDIYIYTYITESLCCIAEINTNIVNQTFFFLKRWNQFCVHLLGLQSWWSVTAANWFRILRN